MKHFARLPVPHALACLLSVTSGAGCAVAPQGGPLPLALPNDNRTPAGALRGDTLELHIVARQVRWRPDGDSAKSFHVLAFAEEGGPPTIPGPLIRVPQGTEMRITVRNEVPDSADVGLPPVRMRGEGTRSVAGPLLVVHGLRAGSGPNDTVHVRADSAREVRFRADTPGTFLYWGAMSEGALDTRTGTDAQLTGAIVVDPVGSAPDPDQRLFVITVTDAFPDSTKSPPGQDIFELGINGLSWPGTERLTYTLGDSVRWRWLNGTAFEHPMHLHGVHFRTVAQGDFLRETILPAGKRQLKVTELVEPGRTFRMEWQATRAGNWTMHCHLRDHVTPFPERDEQERAHDLHGDVEQHALSAMSGLVLGITVASDVAAAESRPQHRLRLIALEDSVRGSDAIIRGFAVQREGEPLPDAPGVPGPPLILTRGATTAITVINRLSEPTTVHWHGMELESVYDGVAGWSRTGTRVAPLVAPGDSFVVQMTPPRAGTFIYHTHMDETEQILGGMYGPLLVLEPGASFDPERDRVFVVGAAVQNGKYALATINGRLEPPSQVLRSGTAYRLRFINISPDATVELTLARNDLPERWVAVAKDAADLPPALRVSRSARLRFSAGETYDFEWTPGSPGQAALVLDWSFPTEPGSLRLQQVFQIR